MRFLEEKRRTLLDYSMKILFNSFSHVFDNIRQIYMKHDNEPSAAERKVLGRKTKFNRTKSEILALLEHNNDDYDDEYCPSNKKKEISKSPKGKAIRDRIKNLIYHAQKIDLNYNKHNEFKHSQSTSTSQTNFTNRTIKNSQSMKSIHQTPKTDAFERKKEEIYNAFTLNRQKTKDKIKEFKQRLDLFGSISSET